MDAAAPGEAGTGRFQPCCPFEKWGFGILNRYLTVVWKVLVIGLAVSQASAQVNVEKHRRDEDGKGLSGSVELNLLARSGNVDVVAVGMGGRVDYAGEGVTTFLVGSGDLGWEGGERFSNEGLFHVRQIYRIRSRLRPEAFVQVNYDKERLLTFRGLLGGGFRMGLFRNDAVQLWLGTAYMFEREHVDLGPNAAHPRRASVSRWSNYLSLKAAFNEQTSLILTAYIQPRFNDLEDVRILNKSSLSVAVSGSVSLVTAFGVFYDSRPPDGTERVDTKLESGVELAF